MRVDRIWSSSLLIFSILYCEESFPLGIGSLRNPGAGLIPFSSGVLLGCLSLSMLIKSTWGEEKGIRKDMPLIGKDWKNSSWVLGSLLFYLLSLERLGFLITTFLFLIFSLVKFRPRKWTSILLISFLTVFISYLIFVTCLKVQLPTGILGI